VDAINLRLEDNKTAIRGTDVEANFSFGSHCS